MSAEMVEMGLENPAAVQVEEQQRRFTISRVVAAGASVLALAGCGNAVKKEANALVGNTPAMASANTACGQAPDFNQYRANTVFGSPEAIFPALQHVENGQETLLPLDQAKQAINKQLESDPRVLGIVTAFLLDTRANLHEPNTATLARAEQLTAFYMNNPDQGAQAAVLACNQIDNYLTSTTKFPVTMGQAFEVQADHQNGQIPRIHTVKVTAANLESGYKLGFNADDPNLTPEQKAIFKRIEDMMLITGKGTLIVDAPIGQGGFNISSNSKNTAPAKVVVNKHGQKVLVTPGANFRAPVGSSTRTGSTTGGGSSSGSFGNSSNNGEGNHPGPVRETGAGSTSGQGGPTGHRPGPAPSFGGGGSGGGGSSTGGGGGGETTPTNTPTPSGGGGGGGETTPTNTPTPSGGGGGGGETTPTTTPTPSGGGGGGTPPPPTDTGKGTNPGLGGA